MIDAKVQLENLLFFDDSETSTKDIERFGAPGPSLFETFRKAALGLAQIHH